MDLSKGGTDRTMKSRYIPELIGDILDQLKEINEKLDCKNSKNSEKIEKSEKNADDKITEEKKPGRGRPKRKDTEQGA